MIEVNEPPAIPYAMGKLVECKYCNNSGRDYEANHVGVLDIGMHRKPCPVCHGSGFQRI